MRAAPPNLHIPPGLRWLLLASVVILATTVILLRQPASEHSPITFEDGITGTPAEKLAIPGLTFAASTAGSVVVARPGFFVTLKGNLLMENGLSPATLAIHFAEAHDSYSFRFATSAPATLTLDGLLDESTVFSHDFSGEVPEGGIYPEGVALGRGARFDTLIVGMEGGSAAFSIDDLGTWPDDRVNAEPDAPVVIYCQVGGIDVYDLEGGGAGRLAIRISDRELDVFPARPAVNTIVASQGDILLSRLTTGEYQVNAGPDSTGTVYVFIWDACPPTKAYDKSFNLSTGPLP